MQLTDGDRIRGLLATYCRLIDAGDFAGVGALMGDAVLCMQDGTPLATGAAQAERLYAGLVRLHEDGTPGTQHVVADTAFDEPASDGSVTATSTYLVFQAVTAVPLQPIITGTYVETPSRRTRRARAGTSPSAGSASGARASSSTTSRSPSSHPCERPDP